MTINHYNCLDCIVLKNVSIRHLEQPLRGWTLLRSMHGNLHIVSVSPNPATTPPSSTAGEGATMAQAELMRPRVEMRQPACAKGTPPRPCGHELENYSKSMIWGSTARCSPPLPKIFTGLVLLASGGRSTDYPQRIHKLYQTILNCTGFNVHFELGFNLWPFDLISIKIRMAKVNDSKMRILAQNTYI